MSAEPHDLHGFGSLLKWPRLRGSEAARVLSTASSTPLSRLHSLLSIGSSANRLGFSQFCVFTVCRPPGAFLRHPLVASVSYRTRGHRIVHMFENIIGRRPGLVHLRRATA
eukprot:2348493-Rhodomonas_salina.1